MNLTDVILVFFLAGAAISGYRNGLVTAMLTLAGASAGAVAGIWAAPMLADLVSDSTAKIAIGIALIIVGVGVGEVVGQWIGRSISSHITWHPAQTLDHGLGMVGQTIAVLIVAWLVAVPLAAAPIPWLSSQIRASAVLGGVDRAMPPSAERISAQIRSVFVGSDFPQILAPLAPAPDAPVDPPDSGLADARPVAAAAPSILKIRAAAPSCSRSMEGSGFVIAPGVIVTNAHVVAGASTVKVEADGALLPATVVRYNPNVDIAVLDVAGLTAPALHFRDQALTKGDDAVAAGYPLDGPFTVTPTRIRGHMPLRGPNIYGQTTVVRDVYTLRGSIKPGNSGGPLLAPDGTVVGVVFGAAIDNPDVGFALTESEVRPVVLAGLQHHSAVPTGNCAAG